MSWKKIGKFGWFLRLFVDMQTGLKKSFWRQKDGNFATNPCHARATISLIITNCQAQFTENIRFGFVCTPTCREMSIDSRTSRRRLPAFGVRQRELRLGIFRSKVPKVSRRSSKSAKEIPKDSPLTFFSYPLASPCNVNVLSWFLTFVGTWASLGTQYKAGRCSLCAKRGPGYQPMTASTCGKGLVGLLRGLRKAYFESSFVEDGVTHKVHRCLTC